MKKSLAILLLIIGSLACILGLSILNMIVFLAAYPVGAVIAIVLTIAAAFGIDRLRALYRRKFDMKAPKFLVLAYVPSVLGAAAAVITVIKLDEAGYFKGILAGLGELLLAFAYLLTAGAILVFAVLWFVISAIVNKYRKVSLNESKD